MTPVDAALALNLLQSLESTTGPVNGAAIVGLLEAWGFVRHDGIDPRDTTGVAFLIHPGLPHLQMTVPSMGWAHSYILQQALGLVRCVQVHGP
jgi:hypothetical protein